MPGINGRIRMNNFFNVRLLLHTSDCALLLTLCPWYVKSNNSNNCNVLKVMQWAVSKYQTSM